MTKEGRYKRWNIFLIGFFQLCCCVSLPHLFLTVNLPTMMYVLSVADMERLLLPPLLLPALSEFCCTKEEDGAKAVAEATSRKSANRFFIFLG